MTLELGTEVDYTNKDDETIRGVVTGIRKSAKTIRNIKTGERWPGIEFRIKPNDGGRQFWTCAYADKKSEAPKEPLLV